MAWFGITLLVLAFTADVRVAAAEVAIIVHPTRTDVLTPEILRRIYLRQQRTWPDRQPILAVNQSHGGDARRAFEQHVLGEVTVRTLNRHWNEQYFLGILPPVVLPSDAAVRQYVASRTNAIGYIDEGSVDPSVRVVARVP